MKVWTLVSLIGPLSVALATSAGAAPLNCLENTTQKVVLTKLRVELLPLTGSEIHVFTTTDEAGESFDFTELTKTAYAWDTIYEFKLEGGATLKVVKNTFVGRGGGGRGGLNEFGVPKYSAELLKDGVATLFKCHVGEK